MGLNSDERNSIERRVVPLDPVEEEDFIPNPPMAKTYRGLPHASFTSVHLERSRGAPSKRVSTSRQATEEDRLSRESESFRMVREGFIVTTKIYTLKPDSDSSASASDQPHNWSSLRQGRLQPSYPQAHPYMMGMSLQ